MYEYDYSDPCLEKRCLLESCFPQLYAQIVKEEI